MKLTVAIKNQTIHIPGHLLPFYNCFSGKLARPSPKV